ncbi:lysylphosphatidylglycerol synthase transmembrane domain-containing protein [Legionella jordanis]|nr:lysylphosphatidylglycerol synthase transmembrane domain-containing protein [Legionella jordanis]
MKPVIKLFGYFLGGFFLLYSFWQVHWDEFLTCIKNIDLRWIIVMAVSLLLSMFLRSIRWQLILGLPRQDMGRVWDATCIGYLGTAIYPAKAGDVLKILRLQKTTGITTGEALMSLIVDRIFDGLALSALLAVSILAWGKLLNVSHSLWLVVAGFMVVFLLLSWFCISGHRLEPLFLKLSNKHSFGKWFYQFYQQSLNGLKLLKSPKRLFACGGIQAFITAFDILACWYLFLAFGWKDLSLLPAIIILVYLAAAFSLPSTPGYIGVYQIASIFALGLFGIRETEAVAYGTVFQTIAFILFVGVGIQAQLGKTKHSLRSVHDSN